MSSFRFVPSQSGIASIGRDPQVGRFVGSLVEQVAQAAQRLAPVETSDYRSSLGKTDASLSIDGWEGTVYSTDPFWHLVEYGSVNNPPHRVLQRAVTETGLEFKDDGR